MTFSNIVIYRNDMRRALNAIWKSMQAFIKPAIPMTKVRQSILLDVVAVLSPSHRMVFHGCSKMSVWIVIYHQSYIFIVQGVTLREHVKHNDDANSDYIYHAECTNIAYLVSTFTNEIQRNYFHLCIYLRLNSSDLCWVFRFLFLRNLD